ncbi:type II toxin-antitoxin system VapC family toxin (plasmid) [Jiella pelagia]|uniref:Type II toxin-antitoxin system VapC family toxin n=2 Tax=Jiella pelagia TaxID=2986949 RepID=A0ABY7BTY0_9HYPH|nr:type II toxin-antitoxin system VapC family toxin [Jiella pelagia]
MADCVLDASALLALIFEEPGRDRVAETVPGASVSAINLAEAATRLLDVGIPRETIMQIFEELQLSVVAVDAEQAMLAADFRAPTRTAGLSLGDRVCMALARHLCVPALMADRQWAEVAEAVSVEVVLVR